ncbi:5-nitroimidazole antibiotic resistance protein [Eggerthellaceae bacterium zg-1084]|uniref:pyridoxamine 5'-phosphate oxidase family protein n=1 Tax=Berryella wangjianweii TaxID=2734634 RepID=UPI001551A5B4|nr:pyridoxamine 5'-phosphate oxidase family protein [Berryella wangjianweii]NPD30436.1 5-nitroimidazole antibiotic resistance protein [Berryella wangjianweii]
MRRVRQQLSPEEARAILCEGVEGVLSLVDAEGRPYGVPINYAVSGNSVYVHSALSGRKVDAIRSCAWGSLCVVGESRMLPETFATRYRSVIAEGPLAVVDDPEEKHAGLMALGRTTGRDEAACEAEVASGIKHCLVMRLDIEDLSAKESLDLAKERRRAAATQQGAIDA